MTRISCYQESICTVLHKNVTKWNCTCIRQEKTNQFNEQCGRQSLLRNLKWFWQIQKNLVGVTQRCSICDEKIMINAWNWHKVSWTPWYWQYYNLRNLFNIYSPISPDLARYFCVFVFMAVSSGKNLQSKQIPTYMLANNFIKMFT